MALPKPKVRSNSWDLDPPKPAQTQSPDKWPKISIVTPSYNQGEFLEETIRSVLSQGYPNLEYIVMDGGSTDNSVEIIKKYEPWIHYWVSEKDQGQSDAIQRGLAKATGEWCNWLNSDDILLPNALFTLAKIAKLDPKSNWISGGRLLLSRDGHFVGHFMPWKNDPKVIGLDCPELFPQEATFFRREWAQENGFSVRKDLHNVMDTALFYQMMQKERPLLTTAVFSALRVYAEQKGNNLENMTRELKQTIEPLRKKAPLSHRFWLWLINQPMGVGLLAKATLRLLLQTSFLEGPRKYRLAVFCQQSSRWILTRSKNLPDWL